MPEPIPDTPRNIMKAFLQTPSKRREEWGFVREREARKATAHNSDSPS